MRIVLVGYHGYPSEAVGARRLSELAIFLSQHGHDTAHFAAADREAWDPRLETADVEQVQVIDPNLSPDFSHTMGDPSSYQPSPVRRVFSRVGWIKALYVFIRHSMRFIDDKKRWSFRLGLRLAREHRRRPFDIVVASGPPFSPLVSAAVFCTITGIPLIADFRDPWSSTQDVGWAWQRTSIRWLQRFVYGRARAITVTTGALKRSLTLDDGRHIEVIPNGFDTWMVRDDEVPRGQLRIVHAGTIYENRDPTALIRALNTFLERHPDAQGRIELALVGDVESDKRAGIESLLSDLVHGDHVTMIGRVSPTEISAMLADYNVLLTLAQQQADCVPAKIFEHVASRRFMLIVTEADSATADMVDKYPRAMVVPDTEDALTGALARLFHILVESGQPLPLLANGEVEWFSRSEANQRYHELIAKKA